MRLQDEPAYCGLATLAMVLNSLSIDPRRPWKGPWRWFHAGVHPASPLAEINQCEIVFVVLASNPVAGSRVEASFPLIAGMLDCCSPLTKVQEEGITLTQVWAVELPTPYTQP